MAEIGARVKVKETSYQNRNTTFKIQTATLLSIKGFCFLQMPLEYAVLQSAATDEDPAMSSICFSFAVALPGNHGAGVGLAGRGCGSAELGESTVA